MNKCMLIAGIWVSWMAGAATSELQQGVYYLLSENQFAMIKYCDSLNMLVIKPTEPHGISRPFYFHSPTWSMLNWCMERGADLNCFDGQGHGFLGFHLSNLPLIDRRRAVMVKTFVEKISEKDPDLLVTRWYGRQRIPIALVCARTLLHIAEQGTGYTSTFWKDTFDVLETILAVTPRDLLQQTDEIGNCLQVIAACRARSRHSNMDFLWTRALAMTEQRYAEVGLSTDPHDQELTPIPAIEIEMPIIFEQRGRCDCVML